MSPPAVQFESGHLFYCKELNFAKPILADNMRNAVCRRSDKPLG